MEFNPKSSFYILYTTFYIMVWLAVQKKAVIVVKLVPESAEVSNTKIEKEILRESTIPWVKEIKKVTVIERRE